jgi:hypothetical protein
MLDLYGAADLYPWPDGLPLARIHLGSLGLEEFHNLLPLIQSCFVGIDVEVSYFSDWVLTADQLDSVLRCLEAKLDATRSDEWESLKEFLNSLARARGRNVLAVCD